jgi:hypothetical protein
VKSSAVQGQRDLAMICASRSCCGAFCITAKGGLSLWLAVGKFDVGVENFNEATMGLRTRLSTVEETLGL